MYSYRYKQDVSYSIGVVIIFILSPFLSIPFIFKGIKYNQIIAYFLLALFLGLAAYLMIPMDDLLRHWNHYNEYKGMTTNVFLYDVVIQGFEFVIPFACWVMVNNNIPFEFLRLFTVFVSFFLLTFIFRGFIKTSPMFYNREEVFKRFLIAFFLFDFFFTANGIRYGFALMQFIFGLYLFHKCKRRFWGVVFLLLATFTHLSFRFIAIMCLFPLLFKYKIKNLITGALIALPFLSVALLFFGDFMGGRFDWYFADDRGLEGRYESMTISGLIFYLVSKLPTFAIGFILLKYYNRDNLWNRLYAFFCAMSLIFLTNTVVLFRFTWLANTSSLLSLLASEQENKLTAREFSKIYRWSALFFAIGLLNMWVYLLNSHYERLFLPIFYILGQYYDVNKFDLLG